MNHPFNLQSRYKEASIATRIAEHCRSDKHKKAGDGTSSQLISNAMRQVAEKQDRDSRLDKQILSAFLAADVPIEKLAHPQIRQLIETHMNHKVKHANTYRRHVASLAEESIARVKNEVGDSDADVIASLLCVPLSVDCDHWLLFADDNETTEDGADGQSAGFRFPVFRP